MKAEEQEKIIPNLTNLPQEAMMMYPSSLLLDRSRASSAVGMRMEAGLMCGVRVEAGTLIPAGTLMGPYPGHFLLGYILTDERSSTHVLKVS